MRRRSFALAAVTAVTLALLSNPRPGIALVQRTDAVDVASVSIGAPQLDLLEVPSIALALPPEPAPVAAVALPVAPDSSAATEAPAVQVAAPPVAAAPVVRVAAPAPPAPATCPSDRFCYPRVGISGTIVPYNDCTGSTDVGSAIRSLSCVSPTFLAAHAWTQFGRIAGWRAGDIVFAYGVRYVIFDAYTQSGCEVPARAIAPLSLQTSLTSANCGPILVVEGRRG